VAMFDEFRHGRLRRSFRLSFDRFGHGSKALVLQHGIANDCTFWQPLAIMASLPLSLIGVMVSLKLFHSTINLFSLIGLIMLMGLVTKNAILLVDFANHARKAGATLGEAVLSAGQIPMRPIVMTTAAMVFGMLPLALALDEGGELQAPMGRAIIGGDITSTLLTQVVVPVIYAYIEQWVGFFRQRLDGRSRGALVGAVLTGLVGVVLAISGLPAVGVAAVMAVAIVLSVWACGSYARANAYRAGWAAMGLLGGLGFLILVFLRPIQDGGSPETEGSGTGRMTQLEAEALQAGA
ncbi:MAG: efflux RND transporter permease subunit, partial [Caulobacter sp.]|nr:efflux RND transporter permease subunit [Vitreoscilla sp.]